MELQKPEDSTGSQDPERLDKPLGRGLEQISHLFLTHRSNGPSGDRPPVRKPDSGVSQSQSRSPAGRTVPLQPITTVAKDRLVALLRESPCVLEEGLRVIDMFVSCHPHSDIDLLAVDRADQLTVIDLETSPNDALLLRGLGHCDWLRHNLPNIRRIYPEQTLDGSRPRLFLIAPKFSSLTLNATRQLAPLQVHWMRYHALDTGGDTGIFFEPIA
jgi:hypothetical protein